MLKLFNTFLKGFISLSNAFSRPFSKDPLYIRPYEGLSQRDPLQGFLGAFLIGFLSFLRLSEGSLSKILLMTSAGFKGWPHDELNMASN